jgi:hypothetical protein
VHVHLSLAFVAIALISGCAANEPMPTNAPLDLSPTQLAQLEKEASAGRGDSAYQISLYYNFVEFN